MSSSEVQRITLSATKLVSPEGIIELDPIVSKNDAIAEEDEEEDEDEDEDVEGAAAPVETHRSVTTKTHSYTSKLSTEGLDNHRKSGDGLTNGYDSSPNKANETITSSIGDITIDSVKDHLNSTTTTLCSTTTEEIVGEFRLKYWLLY